MTKSHYFQNLVINVGLKLMFFCDFLSFLAIICNGKFEQKWQKVTKSHYFQNLVINRGPKSDFFDVFYVFLLFLIPYTLVFFCKKMKKT